MKNIRLKLSQIIVNRPSIMTPVMWPHRARLKMINPFSLRPKDYVFRIMKLHSKSETNQKSYTRNPPFGHFHLVRISKFEIGINAINRENGSELKYL